MNNNKPMVFSASEPYCSIKKEELAEMQGIANRNMELQKELKELRSKKFKIWQWSRKSYQRDGIKVLIVHIEEQSDFKMAWWGRMEQKYNFMRPAIVNMRTGQIILGVPKE